ncbi:hypothetical protein [Pontibacter sp. G13]|uniref:hypothetical protein n=1 Tax=Pontibacter sp. G13 TaxID=3074898 RepID=UPI00288C4061|nr:hypothetical protein [Pontibacter sp. G13]WNJ17268.1 hypothetical protein RJD25_20650 [Pontibacter sp. G13]
MTARILLVGGILWLMIQPTTAQQIPSKPCALENSIQFTSDGCRHQGTIQLTTQGGMEPYRYLWNAPIQRKGPQQTGLDAGIYIVQTTDRVGCQRLDTIHIPAGSPPIAEFTWHADTIGDDILVSITNMTTAEEPWTNAWRTLGSNWQSKERSPVFTYSMEEPVTRIILEISHACGSDRLSLPLATFQKSTHFFEHVELATPEPQTLHLSLISQPAPDIQVKLIDPVGEEVRSWNWSLREGVLEEDLPIGDLPKGPYLFLFDSGGHQLVKAWHID